ncbi:YdcF family protein [Leptolyngbya sp. PCC 6406]|uniref:YdcF family protein n=1 Tax=Leptolyngbya sp. PCC 6406 TaxID=1173264 RepID=UPI0002ACAD71|nr:ElyC/SanA/YdcF family protein [Leptolyngbya sp. PCC 6406]
MLLALLTRILLWVAVGLLIWYVLLKFIPRKFLTWFGGAIILALIVLSFIDPNDQTIGTIWRIISLPLTPLGASVLLLIFALTEGLKKVKGQQVAIALAILLVSSVPLFARALVGQAEQSIQQAYNAQRGICEDICPAVPETAPLSRVVAVVIMGENMDVASGSGYFPSQIDTGSTLNPDLTARLRSGASLYQQLRQNGSNPLVVVTAGPLHGSAEEKAGKEQTLRQVLGAGGIPAEVIAPIQTTGMDVNSTVRRTREILEERQYLSPTQTGRDADRIAIVAPALTMRRTALTFEERGLNAVAWPTDLYGSSSLRSGDTLAQLSDIMPNVEALRLTTRYWDELMTSIYYFLRGWLPGFDVRWNQVVEVVPPN